MKKVRRKKTKNQKKIRKIRKIFRIFEKTNFRKHTISNFCTVEYEQCCIPIDFNPNISEIKAFSGILSEKSSQPKKKRSSQPGQVGQVQRSDLAVHLAYGKTQPGQPDLAQPTPLNYATHQSIILASPTHANIHIPYIQYNIHHGHISGHLL